MKPLPGWLYSRYAKIFDRYGEDSWTLQDAVRAWGDSTSRANVVVSEFRKRGHAVLLKRARRTRFYRLISPSDFLFSSLYVPNLDRVGAEAYKPIILKTVRSIRAGFGSRLVAVGLFGSVARGQASRTSDVDLYMVADWKTGRLSERLDEALPFLKAIDEERSLMLQNGFATDVSIYPASRDDASHFHPLQLDLSVEGIVLYDTQGFLEETWARLRSWLSRKRVQRVETDKGWFWQLDPRMEVGSAIEIR